MCKIIEYQKYDLHVIAILFILFPLGKGVLMNKFASTNPEFKCVYHAKFDWNLSSRSLFLFQGMVKNNIF